MTRSVPSLWPCRSSADFCPSASALSSSGLKSLPQPPPYVPDRPTTPSRSIQGGQATKRAARKPPLACPGVVGDQEARLSTFIPCSLSAASTFSRPSARGQRGIFPKEHAKGVSAIGHGFPLPKPLLPAKLVAYKSGAGMGTGAPPRKRKAGCATQTGVILS
jgi:hypothetical protein